MKARLKSLETNYSEDNRIPSEGESTSGTAQPYPNGHAIDVCIGGPLGLGKPLPYVTFAYHTTWQETTGQTPFFQTLGGKALLLNRCTVGSGPKRIGRGKWRMECQKGAGKDKGRSTRPRPSAAITLETKVKPRLQTQDRGRISPLSA